MIFAKPSIHSYTFHYLWGSRMLRRRKRSRTGGSPLSDKDKQPVHWMLLSVVGCVILPPLLLFIRAMVIDPATPKLAKRLWRRLHQSFTAPLTDEGELEAEGKLRRLKVMRKRRVMKEIQLQPMRAAAR
ncbi:unnamed protein product [Chrysoparadoxa australica]